MMGGGGPIRDRYVCGTQDNKNKCVCVCVTSNQKEKETRSPDRSLRIANQKKKSFNGRQWKNKVLMANH